MAQAGEFSFLLARQGVDAGVVGDGMFSLMLASAAISIVIAPTAARVRSGRIACVRPALRPAA